MGGNKSRGGPASARVPAASWEERRGELDRLSIASLGGRLGACRATATGARTRPLRARRCPRRFPGAPATSPAGDKGVDGGRGRDGDCRLPTSVAHVGPTTLAEAPNRGFVCHAALHALTSALQLELRFSDAKKKQRGFLPFCDNLTVSPSPTPAPFLHLNSAFFSWFSSVF